MELIINQTAQIVLTRLQFFTRSDDLLCDFILLHIDSPCYDKTDDEEHRQHTIQQNLEGVIVIHGNRYIIDRIHISLRTLNAQGRQLRQPAHAGQSHVANKDKLHQQEHQTSEDLTTCNATKTHDEERCTRLPITILKGQNDISEFIADALNNRNACGKQFLDTVPDAAGNANNEAKQRIQEPVPFWQF